MKRMLVALALIGCSGTSKKSDAPPTPTERPIDAAVDAPVATAPPAPSDPAPELEVPDQPPGKKQGQAEIAWARSQEGIELMKQGSYAAATAKFRDAVARMPEPKYFFNLCVSLYQEGRLTEALAACNAVETNSPSPQLETKAKNMSARIRTEARRQGINVE